AAAGEDSRRLSGLGSGSCCNPYPGPGAILQPVRRPVPTYWRLLAFLRKCRAYYPENTSWACCSASGGFPDLLAAKSPNTGPSNNNSYHLPTEAAFYSTRPKAS